MPFGQQQLGSRVFFKNTYQYLRLDVLIPKTVPIGYSIRFVLTGGTVIEGTAYANFESLVYTPLYEYGPTHFLIKNQGPMPIGSRI